MPKAKKERPLILDVEENIKDLFPKQPKYPVNRMRMFAPLKMAQLINKYAFFAGGSVAGYLLGLDFSDYDLYFRTEESYKEFRKEMDNVCGKPVSQNRIVIQDSRSPKFDGYKIMTLRYSWTTEAEFYVPITLFHSIGFIIGEPLAVINTFDLSCSQAAYDPITYRWITTSAFDETKRTRKGSVEQYHSPLKTANRILKYMKRGITFPYGELMKMYMVLETEPEESFSQKKLTNKDPFSHLYNGVGYMNRQDTLKALEEAMGKDDD